MLAMVAPDVRDVSELLPSENDVCTCRADRTMPAVDAWGDRIDSPECGSKNATGRLANPSGRGVWVALRGRYEGGSSPVGMTARSLTARAHQLVHNACSSPD